MAPETRARPRQHWLAAALARAVEDVSVLNGIPASAPVDEAWREACACLEWPADRVAHALAQRYRLERAAVADRDPQAARLLPDSVARKHTVVVVGQTDRNLIVATANPLDPEAEQEISFLSGRGVVFQVATPGELAEATRSQGRETGVLEDVMANIMAESSLDDIRVVEAASSEVVSAQELETTPVVRLTNLILQRAVEAGATDVHIEPERDGGRVRIRVDGVLQTLMGLPLPAHIRVVSRIKILADLDIADRIRPQDGRMRIDVAGRQLDLRISTIPVHGSEKVVIRILDPEATFDLHQLGLDAQDQATLHELLSHRNGIVLVTGPTGSGKTTTLYAALATLSSSELNISTVEQPVEYELRGISQIQVEPKRGVTFASALRALLRQDPDVILVGEIRDDETAQIAAQASMTGHQVLSTLHTNDALGAVSRLEELGLEASVVASTLRGVVAQRLVRRFCPRCVRDVRNVYELDEAEQALVERTGVMPPRLATGCPECRQTGFRGRVPVVEILTVDRQVARLIADGASGEVIRARLSDAGHPGLRERVLERVRQGLTSLVEADRVVGVAEAGSASSEAVDPRDGTPGEPSVSAGDGGESGGAPPASVGQGAPFPGAAGGSPNGAGPAGGLEEPSEEPSERPGILVVEDDGGTRALIKAALSRTGFTIHEAVDGQEALDVLEGGLAPALVTLDLNMPRVGGLQVLEWMRANPSTRDTPVVVATHSEDEASELQLLSAGADDYMIKPLNPARLLTRVQAVLRRHQIRTGGLR